MTRAATGPALQRVVPVLAAQMPLDDRVVRVGHITGRVHVGRARASDASVRMPLPRAIPAVSCERGVRHRADPDQHEVGRHGSRRRRRLPPPSRAPAIRSTCTLRAQIHAIFGVEATEDLTHHRADRERERHGVALEDRHCRCRGSAPSRPPPSRSTPSRSARVACRRRAVCAASASESSRRRSVRTPSRSCPSRGSDRGRRAHREQHGVVRQIARRRFRLDVRRDPGASPSWTCATRYPARRTTKRDGGSRHPVPSLPAR